MAGATGLSRDDAGYGIEPPVEARVRRALGLLERFAPAHYRILRHRPAINAGLDFIGRATVAATSRVERVTPTN